MPHCARWPGAEKTSRPQRFAFFLGVMRRTEHMGRGNRRPHMRKRISQHKSFSRVTSVQVNRYRGWHTAWKRLVFVGRGNKRGDLIRHRPQLSPLSLRGKYPVSPVVSFQLRLVYLERMMNFPNHLFKILEPSRSVGNYHLEETVLAHRVVDQLNVLDPALIAERADQITLPVPCPP